MQLEFTFHEIEADITELSEEAKNLHGVKRVALVKTDKNTQSLYDTLAVLFESPEAAVAVATGLGALLAKLGNRAKVTIKRDGSVVAERVSSKDAAKIVAKAVDPGTGPDKKR